MMNMNLGTAYGLLTASVEGGLNYIVIEHRTGATPCYIIRAYCDGVQYESVRMMGYSKRDAIAIYRAKHGLTGRKLDKIEY